MSQVPDYANLKQENEELKKKNEELEKQLEIIRKATEELEKFREGAVIERIATEARSKVLQGLGVLGIASIAGFFGIYTTTVNTIRDELLKPERFNKIVEEITNASKKEVTAQISENVSKKLFEEFKKDEDFQKKLTNAVAGKVLKDSEFAGRINAIAATAADTAVKQIGQYASSSSELSVAVDKSFGEKSYFVVASSSTEPNNLSSFITKAANLDLKAKICPPKEGNRRSVLLVTNTASISLNLDAANAVVAIAKNIEPTAYILPTEPANNVFFDLTKCK